MNPFKWISQKVYEAFADGTRRFFADIHPEAPPADLNELRALLASNNQPALPAVEDEPPARKRAK